MMNATSTADHSTADDGDGAAAAAGAAGAVGGASCSSGGGRRQRQQEEEEGGGSAAPHAHAHQPPQPPPEPRSSSDTSTTKTAMNAPTTAATVQMTTTAPAIRNPYATSSAAAAAAAAAGGKQVKAVVTNPYTKKIASNTIGRSPPRPLDAVVGPNSSAAVGGAIGAVPSGQRGAPVGITGGSGNIMNMQPQPQPSAAGDAAPRALPAAAAAASSSSLPSGGGGRATMHPPSSAAVAANAGSGGAAATTAATGQSAAGTGTATGTGTGTASMADHNHQQKPLRPSAYVPRHERLPSRRITFTSAEILTVSELSDCIGRIVGGRIDESGGSNKSKNNKSNEISVRTTGVLLHVDIVGKFILLGDPTSGARPIPPSAAASTRMVGGLGGGLKRRATPGSARAGASLGGGRRQSSGGLGGNGGGGQVPGKTPARTPVNRYRRTSFGVGGKGTSVGNGGGSGGGGLLLGTSAAKKRRLVYSKPGAAAAASASASASGATATSGASADVAAATPRPNNPLLSRRKLVPAAGLRGSAAAGLGLGTRTPRTPAQQVVGALDVIRQQRQRGADLVAVDISVIMAALNGCRVGDTVMVIGEIRDVVPASSPPSSSGAGAAPPPDGESEDYKKEAGGPSNAASEPSPLQKALSALGTDGKVLVGRIMRNVNGTDMNLMAEALRLRREHIRERCWDGAAVLGEVPGIGVERLLGSGRKVNEVAASAATTTVSTAAKH